MFSFIKNSLEKIYTAITSKAQALFSRTTIDTQTLADLELLLISADAGVKTTKKLIEQLKKETASGTITTGKELKQALQKHLIDVLHATQSAPRNCSVFLLVGINGSGKTTACSKLAYSFIAQGKKVLLVAADTFRAAATEQLVAWAHTLDTPIVTGIQNQDPASVVFAGCQRFAQEHFDILIVDTAGRLQTKINLMKELEKIKRIIIRQLPTNSLCTLLTIDAMLGQNSFEQAHLFHESTQVDGIILTKMDGTGKGGIVFAISQELGIPVTHITFGEKPEEIRQFDAHSYVQDLFE